MRDHQFKCFEANTRHSWFAGGLADHAGAFALEHTLKVHRRRQRCLELILGMFLVLGALYPKARFYEIGLGVKQKGPPIEPSLSSRLFIIAGGLLAALDGIRRMTHHRVKTRGDRKAVNHSSSRPSPSPNPPFAPSLFLALARRHATFFAALAASDGCSFDPGYDAATCDRNSSTSNGSPCRGTPIGTLSMGKVAATLNTASATTPSCIQGASIPSI